MLTIFPIVEGHGDQEAFPILLRRFAQEIFDPLAFECLRAYRLPRTRLRKEGELNRAVQLGSAKLEGRPGRSAIVILMDADTDCPAELALAMRAMTGPISSNVAVRFVAAKQEFESWFLASASAYSGRRRFRARIDDDLACETRRNPKALVETRMLLPGESYRETVDQPAMAAAMDLRRARSAPSFDKLWRDIESLIP